MKRLTFAASLGLAVFAFSGNASANSTCARTFTVHMETRAIYAVYAGTRVHTTSEISMLDRIMRCQRNSNSKPYLRGVWTRTIARWNTRRDPPMDEAIASVYDAAGGPIACGGDSYAMGVANKTLPCGTQLEICYNGCVTAVVFDRGPYVYPRDFDLSRAVENAVGFPDGVATIHYRIIP